MEVVPGVCYLCNSDNVVLSSEYSFTYLNKVSSLFEGIDLSDVKLEICPSCVFRVTLVESKKSVLGDVSDTAEVSDQCKFCSSNINVFKITPSHLKYSKFHETNVSLWICDGCFYAMDTAINFKERLMLLIKGDSPENIQDDVSTLNDDLMMESNSECASHNGFAETKDKMEIIDGKVVDKISQLFPLSKSSMKFDDKIKQDSKFYSSIPYVKVENSKFLEKKKCRKRRVQKIPGKKQTSPFKIKFKFCNKNLKKSVKRDLTSSLHQKVQESSVNWKKEPIINVTRMKFDEDDQDVTPKKKRRVHFNETPTIYITDSEEITEARDVRFSSEDLNDSLKEETIDIPSEGTSDSPSEGTSDSPSEGTSDSPSEGTSDSPSEGTSDTPNEGTSDTPSERVSDAPSEGTSDTPSEGNTDTLKEKIADRPSEGTADTPVEKTVDELAEEITNTIGDKITEMCIEENTEKLIEENHKENRELAETIEELSSIDLHLSDDEVIILNGSPCEKDLLPKDEKSKDIEDSEPIIIDPVIEKPENFGEISDEERDDLSNSNISKEVMTQSSDTSEFLGFSSPDVQIEPECILEEEKQENEVVIIL